MLHLLKKMLGGDTDPYSMTLNEAIELVVEESVHKIRLIKGYQKKLRQPVETALKHCADLSKNIPGILDISNKDKASVDLLRCIFDNEAHAYRVVSESSELKRFLDQNNAESVYLLLTMTRQEKTSFGSRLQGEIIVRDVLQKAVLFEDLKLVLPSETIEDAFHSISLGLLKVLAHLALENTLAMQKRKINLEKLKDEVEVKLKILKSDRQQLAIKSHYVGTNNQVVEAQKLLKKIEEQLDTVESQADHKDFYLNELVEVLDHPAGNLSADLIPLRINRLGFFVKEESCNADGAECVAEFQTVDDKRRSVLLLKCHRDQLKIE